MKRETILHALEHIQSKLEEKEIVAIQGIDNCYKCPLCGKLFVDEEIIKYGYKYCYRCGQRVDFTLPRNEIKEEEPQLYNGRVVCVESICNVLTEGKIYNVVNGVITFDNGEESREYEDFDDIQASFFSKFIEVTGELGNSNLYTGRVICVDGDCDFTNGKIYTVVDGVLVDDDDYVYRNIEKLEDIKEFTKLEFLEIKE